MKCFATSSRTGSFIDLLECNYQAFYTHTKKQMMCAASLANQQMLHILKECMRKSWESYLWEKK